MNSALGNRVKSLRGKHNLTQAALAEILGISSQFISFIERGERGMGDETITNLSNYFKVSKDELIQLSNEQLSYPLKTDQSFQNQISLPDDIQQIVDILLTMDVETRRDLVKEVLENFKTRFFKLLKMYSFREIKQEVLNVRSKWLSPSNGETDVGNIKLVGAIQFDEPLYFTLIHINNVLQVSMLATNKSQVKIFEEWIDQHQVNIYQEESIPHISDKQKVCVYYWFSLSMSTIDKYNFLMAKNIDLTKVECNDPQLRWFIQFKNSQVG